MQTDRCDVLSCEREKGVCGKGLGPDLLHAGNLAKPPDEEGVIARGKEGEDDR
jgi:hypothetical protein